MQVQPYLHFNGLCDQAIEFYKSAVGAKVEMLMRFKECPEPHSPAMNPAMANKVMHASLRIGDSTVLVSDGRCDGQTKFDGFSMSITVSNDAEAQRAFNALAQGGKVNMPLAKTFFSSNFGMLVDRFGVSWMVYVAQ